jgi:hypothetical protein
MAEEGFLRRWARRKTELRSDVREGQGPAPARSPEHAPAPLRDGTALAAPVSFDGASLPQPAQTAEMPAAERPLPTMEDVATLDKDSDFSAFVARGVDQAVRRGALKKLFADPHFHVMDRLDVYIDDYTRPSPVSEAMLASLEHAKSVFRSMLEEEPEEESKAEPQAQAQTQTQQPPEQETQ